VALLCSPQPVVGAGDGVSLAFLPCAIVVGLADCLAPPHPGSEDWVLPRPQESVLELETAFGLIAGVLVVSALAAGLVERAPLSFPMLFLGLGFLLGEQASGLSRSA
jgi:hypothetical protein